jgi:polyisoprenoid-binding protein YceI
MIRVKIVSTLIVLASAASACSDPAADAAKAVTSEPSGTRPALTGDATAVERLAVGADNSRIEFAGSKVTGVEGGSFKKFSGTIQLVDGKPEKSRVEIAIDMDSVVTDSPGLAEHLKNADFFDAPRYPQATFDSAQIKTGGEGGATHTVTGDLELHGVKKSVTFPAAIKVDTDAATLEAEFAINRKDFGITYAGRTNDLIRDEVVVKLHVRVPRERHR